MPIKGFHEARTRSALTRNQAARRRREAPLSKLPVVKLARLTAVFSSIFLSLPNFCAPGVSPGRLCGGFGKRAFVVAKLWFLPQVMGRKGDFS